MALSDIDISSNALVRLGDDSINSFTGSDAAAACGVIYPFIKQTVLTSYPWRVSMKKSGLLSRDATGPTTEYKYSYQLPTDRITQPRRFSCGVPQALMVKNSAKAILSLSARATSAARASVSNSTR